MKNITVILDNVRSALNVGAIFRTCEGLGVSELLLTGITPYPPHNKLLKTALGAQDMVPWQYFKTNQEAIEYCNAQHIELYAIEITDDAQEYFTVEYPDNVAIVMGHEITGVSMDFIQAATQTIYIPMQGKKESLNVATTTGIISSHLRFTA